MFWFSRKRENFDGLEAYKVFDASEMRLIARDGTHEYWSRYIAPLVLEASLNGNNSIQIKPSINFQSVKDFGEKKGYKVVRLNDYDHLFGGYNYRLKISW